MLYGFADKKTAEKLKAMAAAGSRGGKAEGGLIRAALKSRTLFLAKTTAAHGTGITRAVDVYAEDETDLQFQVDAKNLFDEVANNEWILIGKPGDTWLVIPMGNACTPQNEIQYLQVFGKPTGGDKGLIPTVNNVTETRTIVWDSTAAQAQTAMEGHTEIGVGDIAVTGGPLPNATLRFEFKGALANTEIPVMRVNTTGLTGGTGVGAIVAREQLGRA